MAGGIGPVEGAAIGAPGQTVGGSHREYFRVGVALNHGGAAGGAVRRVGQGVAFDRVQGGVVCRFGFVQGAHPKAALRVAFAIIGAHVPGVVVQCGDVFKRATPGMGAKNAMAHRNDPPAVFGGRHAAGLAGQVPGVDDGVARAGAQDLSPRNIDPVKPAFLWMPEGGFAQLIGRGGNGGPGHVG